MTDGFVFKKLGNILQEEYGGTGVRFLKPENVTMYDGHGNEVIIPKCEKCGIHKSQLMGKESFMWFCDCCGAA